MQGTYLAHYGVLGMHWGIRRYQNPDGTLTEAGKRHYDKLDTRWASKNYNKVTKRAYKQSRKELKNYTKELDKYMNVKNPSGTLNKQYINKYNKFMASAMTEKVSNIKTPSGKVIKFVANRGSLGVQMAIATPNYDVSQFKNGVYANGKIAYKKKYADQMSINAR